MVFPQIALIALLLPSGSFAAEDPFEGLTVSQTIPNNLVTHYSATPRGGRQCRLEGGAGGRDESNSGLRPSQYRLDHPKLYKGRPTVLAAVPQRGGTAGVFGCFFALPDAHPGVLFYAGDRYGSGSNGKRKTDVSSPCTKIVNKSVRSRLVVYNCPGKKGGYAPPVKRDVAKKEPPKAKQREPASESFAPAEDEAEAVPGDKCQWFAILSCAQSPTDARDERARFGASARLINTSSYSNFSPGWYCVGIPASSQSDAQSKVRSYRSKAPTAYAKKGC